VQPLQAAAAVQLRDQERLGHSSIAITLDTYSHALPAMQEDAASLATDLINAAGDHSVTSSAQPREA